MTPRMRGTAVCLWLALVLSPSAFAQSPVAGRWEGAITVMGQDLGIVVVITDIGSVLTATIDIPQQGAKAIPLRNVRSDGTRVQFQLVAGPGLAVFEGTLKEDVISGTFEQGQAKGTFEIRRAAPPKPEPPPPYRQEEVTIPAGAVTLAGTLTVPATPGAHPAVVLITGSDPQNRDEEIFGFKPFRLLADHLTRAGIAVLRCDDRGVGGSTGNVAKSTTADFAEDVLAEVRFIESRADIDRARIGLIGHGEGGLVAPMVAVQSKSVAFIVLMSGPALSGEKILLAQAELIAGAERIPADQVRANADLQRMMFAAVRSGIGWEAVTEAGEKLAAAAIGRLPEAQRKAIGDPQAAARQQIAAQVASARSPWFKYFLDYDPAPTLARVQVPVLAIFGEKDRQVPAAANQRAMEEVFSTAGPKDRRIVMMPGANHLYQQAVTGSVGEYATLKKEFLPGFLDLLTAWISERTGRTASK
jgi:pimeloyl-ACP methyl ester carboxylesterase